MRFSLINLSVCNSYKVINKYWMIKKIYNYSFVNKIMKKNTLLNVGSPVYLHGVEHLKLRFPRTLGQRASDTLTKWAGSWIFILSLAGLLVIWIVINTSWLIFGQGWDPYPFILLNFVLSTLAAVQTPVILMSQNRQSQKDHQQFQYDYNVNKKAEKEIQEVKKQLDRIEKNLLKKRR